MLEGWKFHPKGAVCGYGSYTGNNMRCPD